MKRLCLLLTLAAACQGSDSHATTGDLATSTPADLVAFDLVPPACPALGAVECVDGGSRRVCEEQGAALVWGSPIACAASEACRDGACTAPSATQLQRATALAELVDKLAAVTSYPYPYDPAAIKAAGELEIFHGGDTEPAYLAAIWHAFLKMPEGHQSLFLTSGCGTKLSYSYSSRFGVCARQDPNGLIVTYARAGNGLGLSAGERVIAAGDDTGAALLATSYQRPLCGSSFPSASGQRESAATNFFGTVPAGTPLRVQAVDGTQRDVIVPTKADAKLLWCGEVFGRSVDTVAEATTLPDGTAVIRLPSFVPFDEDFPTDPSLYEDYRARFQARIKAVFDTVKDAPRLIWDLRGNGGGLTKVGLAIASGMPGAQSTLATHCTARLADTSPPAFDSFHYAEYALEPGGDFLYSGKVAILIDGLGYSATDYFAHFVRHATSAVVIGSPTAGAFGGGSGMFDVTSASPSFTVYYDVNRCVATADDSPLESVAAAPTMTVYYDPADLAAGKDTLVEAAIAALQ